MVDCRPPGVLLIVDVFPPGNCGIGDYSACLARAMAARGVAVRVLTKAVGGAPTRESVDGFEVRRLAGRWSFADLRRVLAEADAMGPGTILHVQYPSRTGYDRRPMINLLPAMARIARSTHPVVVTMHEYHEHRLRWRARVLPMLLGQSGVVAVRRVDYGRLAPWLRLARSPAAMVPNVSSIPAVKLGDAQRRAIRRELGFDSSGAMPTSAWACDEPGHEDEAMPPFVLVFFGDVRPDKGVHSLLDAAESVRRRGLDARLLLISGMGNSSARPSAYEDDVLARIEAGRRAGWATLVRGADASRVASLLGAADLAVFPFTLGASENRTSLLAATANGLPVLTTRGPSTPPGFEAAYGVAAVPAGDADALAREVLRLARRPDAREELRRKALSAAGSTSWDEVARATIAVYRKCRK